MDESDKSLEIVSNISTALDRIHDYFPDVDDCDDPRDKLRALYLSEYLADIHFKIGANGERLPAHRFVLYLNKCATVFDNQNEVAIDDTDCHSFQLFLGYLYNKKIDLTEDDVPHVMRLCDRFECDALRQICCKFKLKCINQKYENELKQLLMYAPINSLNVTKTANVSTKRPFVNSFEPVVVNADINDMNNNKKARLNDATTNPIAVNTQCNIDSVADLNNGSNGDAISASNVDINGENGSNICIDYRLIKQHRCHNNNEPNVSVWRSIFVPILESEPKLIVTCGGYTSSIIEFLNSDQTKVIKSIKKIETETLFSVSCTVLSSDDNTSLISGKHVVIALGGEKCIYFLYNHRMYRKMTAHNGSVYSLVFHAQKPLWLFSASSDKTIKLWDIGVIAKQNSKIVPKETNMLWSISTEFSLLSVRYSFKYDTLIACGESSDVLFFKNISSLKPFEAKVCVGDQITTISCLTFAHDSKYIALRPSKSDEILVTNFSAINEIIEARSKTKNNNRAKVLEIQFVRMASLRYSAPLDDRPFIYLCERSGIVACGDDSGRVFLYDLRSIKVDDLLEPIKILDLPRDDQSGDSAPPIILSVDISHDFKHITASTNNNLVCIWKLVEKN